MTVYIMMNAGLLFFLVLSKYRIKLGYSHISGMNLCKIFTFILLFLIMALRASEVGVDTITYSKIYKIIGDSPSLLKAMKNAPLSAPVYVVMCRVLYFISKDPQFLIIVSALLTNTGLMIFLNHCSDDFALSAFCWVGLTLFYCSMNGSRQCLSLVVLLNALYALNLNLKSVKGWFLYLMAIGIHSTAAVGLVAVLGILLVEKAGNIKRVFAIAVGICGAVSLLFSPLITLFVKIFSRYSMYLDGKSRYSIFRGTGGGRIALLYLFLLGTVCLWMLMPQREVDTIQRFHNRMMPALVFCSIFGIVNCRNELINRMLWYFLALFVTFIPNTVLNCTRRYRGFLKAGIVMVLLVYSFLSLRENHNGVVPYVTFFS